MLIGSLCDSGSAYSVGFQEYYYLYSTVARCHFLFRNKLILILLIALNHGPSLSNRRFLLLHIAGHFKENRNQYENY